MNKIKCYLCKNLYISSWTEQEKKLELEGSPWEIPGDEIDSLCDECFIIFKIWFESLSEEQRNEIKNQSKE